MKIIVFFAIITLIKLYKSNNNGFSELYVKRTITKKKEISLLEKTSSHFHSLTIVPLT